ncbi:helix-turn-helix transcriptional regulator [Egbenema bharatensis]|uniref:helix-turn-helix transcriptional regulator n=1 Tax=Egbenema bharatensis TaxID=3463334 RepID=UPI003A83D1FF
MSDQPKSEEQPTLKALRERVGLSQEGLARLIGVSSKTISNWERGIGAANLTVPQMKALCKALNVTLDELPDSFSS